MPGPQRGVTASLEELCTVLSGLLENRPAVIQQGIPLAQVGGRPFDIRVLAQKDSRGHWVVTGAAARVAPPGSFLTNVGAGGEAVPLERVILHMAAGDPGPADAAAQRVREVSLAVCRALDARWGALGELGIDLGFDPSWKL